MLKPIIEVSFACFLFKEKYGSFLQTLFLYVLSFLKRKYERKQFGICWFAKQAKQASPRGAKNPEAPLKSSRRRLSAPSALPKQRRKCSSNLKMFFDCAGLLCLRGRDKVRAFCPIFSEYKSKRSGNPLL